LLALVSEILRNWAVRRTISFSILNERTSMSDPALLEVKNLVKSFPGVQAVNGVSFSIPRGQCFGLLGPNGAGKTTTIEIIEGITKPTSGDILFKGHPIGREFKLSAGIQFQATSLQEYLTVRETIEMFAHLYSKTVQLEELYQLCDLTEFLDREALKVSGGQRQRMLLAVALVNDPEILFLDEPTTGLDPQARRQFWSLIEKLKTKQKTIILTTHYMEEAYALCDEIAIMDHGKIIAQGAPDELLRQYFDTVTLVLPVGGEPLPEEVRKLSKEIVERPDGLEIRTSQVNQTLQALIGVGRDLSKIHVRSSTLEDLFLHLTGKELRES
jgi:ABC-2 type transport system ATP-binding protein